MGRDQVFGWKCWASSLKEGLATHFSFLPGESHGQRSLAGCSPQGHKEPDMAVATQRTSNTAVATQRTSNTAEATQRTSNTAVATQRTSNTAEATQHTSNTAVATQRTSNTAEATQHANTRWASWLRLFSAPWLCCPDPFFRSIGHQCSGQAQRHGSCGSLH